MRNKAKATNYGRLVFGDQDSIWLKDDRMIKRKAKELQKKVKCPFCGGRAVGYYEYDIREKTISWEFDCEPTCINYSEIEANINEERRTDIRVKSDFLGNIK